MNPPGLRILNRAQVRTCVADIDPVLVVDHVLRSHSGGSTVLPAEGYLAWLNESGAACRSLAMLGMLTGSVPAIGLKVINAALSNPSRGLERAGGCGFLFDPDTARPRFMAEVDLISALRTSAYTVLSLRHLGPREVSDMAFIGTGTLARAHLELLARQEGLPGQVHVHDADPGRARQFQRWARQAHPSLPVTVHVRAEDAVSAAVVVITTTTTTEGYIPSAWLRPGTFVAHVSLDDLLPDVFLAARAIYVDDVGLVRENPRRVLGRLIGDGSVPEADGPGDTRPGRVTGSLGDVLVGRVPAIRPGDGVVVSNPFGLGVLDVGLLAAVEAGAVRRGLGTVLDLEEDVSW